MVLKSPFPDIIIPTKPFGKYILDSWDTYDDSIAIIDNLAEGKTYTYRQLHSGAIKCARALRGLGIGRGDEIAICCSSSAEYMIIIVASVWCGAVVKTCNPTYGKDDMISALGRSKPKGIFIDGEAFAMMNEIVQEHVSSIQFVISVKYCEDCLSFWPLLDKTKDIGKKHDSPWANCRPAFCSANYIEETGTSGDPIMLISTSGTTGKPKDIILTSANVVSILTFSKIAHRHSRKDVLLMVIPLFRGGGFMFSFMCLDQGATLVLEKWLDYERTLSSIEERKATMMIAVPLFLSELIKCPVVKQYDTSSLDRIICLAAPMPKNVADSVVKIFGARIIQSYGLSECMKITSALDSDSPQTSVGTLNSNIMLKVIDLQTGFELCAMEKGELWVKAPQLMKGYLDRPDLTAQCIDADGWFRTGDYGYYDDHGYVYVIERVKDLIHCGKSKLAPSEIDSILLSHPKIADAGVVGVPIEKNGEVAVVFVVRKDNDLTETDIMSHIKDKIVLPDLLQKRICFIKEIPRNGFTKIDRRRLLEIGISQE